MNCIKDFSSMNSIWLRSGKFVRYETTFSENGVDKPDYSNSIKNFKYKIQFIRIDPQSQFTILNSKLLIRYGAYRQMLINFHSFDSIRQNLICILHQILEYQKTFMFNSNVQLNDFIIKSMNAQYIEFYSNIAAKIKSAIKSTIKSKRMLCGLWITLNQHRGNSDPVLILRSLKRLIIQFFIYYA